ncbi:MAG: transcriptional regulator [Spirochaetes bacterium GWD1_61_31]|nr:MAG: transcriptional regulator [Spirochaetes bacterium GWB1_60_80]OHD34221.1 MAG: transcriptional regulator [Spirochaetes bacterium GWC1_61_12]OHD40149.1 MAG: transcriptional regulator [Spirochaetes bacterium GWD1_61_31]OHD45803.1 MAG: transcriptional regulator [Spirochaetes bacterium GWE1_60_18]OHD58345.1 MAG: transcriptional regulator [Spirochaetes bacterium GWF1_60_12]HAW86344.1 transcriptional regulator [Spirochaetaceae bacterium]
MSVQDSSIVEENIGELSRTLAMTGDERLISDFLYSLLTPAEADEIAKRWALVKRLAEGEPQRAIAAEFGMSLCKITRGSRELKKANSAFKRMLELAGYQVP